MGAFAVPPYLWENPFALPDFCFVLLYVLSSIVIKGPPAVNEESFLPEVELEVNLDITEFLTLCEQGTNTVLCENTKH